jgi:hypothetical protein
VKHLVLQHPRLAGASFLLFGCALAALIAVLLVPVGACENWVLPVAREERRSQELAEKIRILHDFNDLVEQVSTDLIAGRTSLKTAVGDLEQSEKAKESRWLEILRTVYSADSGSASLATALIQHVRVKLSRRKAACAGEILEPLAAEYRTIYGSEPVLPPLLADPEPLDQARLQPFAVVPRSSPDLVAVSVKPIKPDQDPNRKSDRTRRPSQ